MRRRFRDDTNGRRADVPARPAVVPEQGPPGSADAFTSLQRLAGNRAASGLAEASVQRAPGAGTTAPPSPAAETARVAALEASYARNVAGRVWRAAARDLNGFNDADIAMKVALLNHQDLVALATGARLEMPTWHHRVTAAVRGFDAEADRVGELTFAYEVNVAAGHWDVAVVHLNGFNDTDIVVKLTALPPAQLASMRTAAHRTRAGGGRMARLVDAVAGVAVTSESIEQVGGREFVVRGGYTANLTPTAIKITVGMNFTPDAGVTVPASTWFGFITSTWNHFSAVNQANRSEKKSIDFVPVQGAGHDIKVSAGNGRANAGHYYTGASNLAQVVPHEFGHLIGLEDEYERDAGDYARVTGSAAPAGTGAAAAAAPIARGIHDALFLGERVFEWHRTAERRRMQAVNQVLAANHIVPNYQAGRSALTREVAIQYVATYGHEMSQDFMARVDSDTDEFNTWREQVLGTFQVTNTSIMGDMSDHTHPVQPRHVRSFALAVQQALGRGTWQPEQDH